MSRVLVLLGHKNTNAPALCADARARCARAVEILEADPNLRVLATGSFGPEFNPSIIPHGQLLTDELVNRGIDASRILPYTNSSNTLEDAFVARRTLDEGVTDLIVVTSDYHLDRVKYIFHRVFPDFGLTFEGVPSQATARDRRKERKKLKHAKESWVDVPLYRHAGKGKDELLPEIYEGAGTTHAHYDNVSLALFSGMVAIFLFPYAAELNHWSAFLFSAGLILIILVLYLRIAKTAHVARTVQQLMEVQFHSGGFSAAYYRQWWVRRGRWKWMTMRFLVTLAAILLSLVQVRAGLQLYCSRNDADSQRQTDRSQMMGKGGSED